MESTAWLIVTVITILALFVFGFKAPQGVFAIYLNGMFIATLLLTHTGINLFAGTSILMISGITLLYYLLREVGIREFWDRLKGWLPLLVVLIAIDMVIAFLYGTRSSYGAMKIIRFVSINAFFFFGLILFARPEEKLYSFLKYTAFFGLVYALASLVGMLMGDPMAMYGWNNRIWFSRSLGLTLILFYFFWGTGEQRKYVRLSILGIFILALMFLNASRGPVIALFVALLIFEIFDVSGVNWKKRGLHMLILTAVFYVIFWSNSPLTKPLANAAELNDQMISITEKFNSDAGGTGNERLIIWKDTLGMIQEHPVLGIGTGSFHTIVPYKPNEPYLYPHNIVLEVMVEQGIPGVLLWLGFGLITITLSIRGILQKSRGQRIYLISLAILAFGLANAMLSGNIPDNPNIFVAAGLAWSAHLLERRETFS
ncbi:O-antigen ligase family protein [Desulfitobacterium sp.]|uniref:O-antigen ligase family protein n=1 Tax=Desulfitobacterium sp. TaxID=49981 RepID=UPI002B205160|nr:O-antigen ligase family protein [Desulfitobacterium sp.]MEA4901452.1 O-antigen ligase family protein [Desulfitobacterium sp.]